MHIVHYITRLIVGGAQENTLLTCEDQHSLFGDKVTLITGPGVGPEGSLEERARRQGLICGSSTRHGGPFIRGMTGGRIAN